MEGGFWVFYAQHCLFARLSWVLITEQYSNYSSDLTCPKKLWDEQGGCKSACLDYEEMPLLLDFIYVSVGYRIWIEPGEV